MPSKRKAVRRQQKRRGTRSLVASSLPPLTFNNEPGNGVTRKSFTYHVRFVTSATVSRVDLNPLGATSFFGPEIANFAALFKQYRIAGIRVVVLAPQSLPVAAGNSNSGQAIGWDPMTASNPPTTVDHIMELTKAYYITDNVSIPTEFSLTRRDLMRHSAIKWYDVFPFTADADFANMGSIYHVGAGTNAATQVVTWLVHSQWEFQAPNATGLYLSNKFAYPPLKCEEKDEKKCSILRPPGVLLTEDPEDKSSTVIVSPVEKPATPLFSYRDVVRRLIAEAMEPSNANASKGPPCSNVGNDVIRPA